MRPGPARQAAKAEYEQAHPLEHPKPEPFIVRLEKLLANGEEILRRSREKYNGND